MGPREQAARALNRSPGSRGALAGDAPVSSTWGASSDKAAVVIEAALFEYSLLRDEILHIRSRQTQLVVFVGAGVGALISSTLLTTYGSDRGALAAILFVAALVVGAATVNYVGNANMIVLIGTYLADRSDDIRLVLSEMPELTMAVPPGLFTWERRSIRAAINFTSAEGLTVWGPASFELISMSFLGLALWLSGAYVMFANPGSQTGIDYILLAMSSLTLLAIIVWSFYGLRYNQNRGSTPE
jgi:hypothetical protein